MDVIHADALWKPFEPRRVGLCGRPLDGRRISHGHANRDIETEDRVEVMLTTARIAGFGEEKRRCDGSSTHRLAAACSVGFVRWTNWTKSVQYARNGCKTFGTIACCRAPPDGLGKRLPARESIAHEPGDDQRVVIRVFGERVMRWPRRRHASARACAAADPSPAGTTPPTRRRRARGRAAARRTRVSTDRTDRRASGWVQGDSRSRHAVCESHEGSCHADERHAD